jgi:pimeloyl-ACP methyl ester carboxylesterase
MFFEQQGMTFISGWSFTDTLWQPIAAMIEKTVQQARQQKILIGWSLGGLQAIKLCALEPERYDKLILINSTPYFSKFSHAYWQAAESDLLAFQAQFLRWVFYPQHPRKVKNWQQHWIAATEDSAELLRANLNYLFTTNLSELYPKLKLPILRLQGNKDAIVFPWSPSVPMPHETVHLLSGGHALPMTHTATLATMMSNFLCIQ